MPVSPSAGCWCECAARAPPEKKRSRWRDVAHLASPAALEHDAVEVNIRVLALDRPIAPGFDRYNRSNAGGAHVAFGSPCFTRLDLADLHNPSIAG